MLWHLSLGGKIWDTLVLRVVLEMVMPTAEHIRNTIIRLRGEPRVAMIRNEAFNNSTSVTIGSLLLAFCHFIFSSTQCLKSNMNFRETIFRRCLTLNTKVRNDPNWHWRAFVLSHSLSMTSIIIYLFTERHFFQKLNEISRIRITPNGKRNSGNLNLRSMA